MKIYQQKWINTLTQDAIQIKSLYKVCLNIVADDTGHTDMLAQVLAKTVVALIKQAKVCNEIKKLRSILRQQVMIYQVDDQAWDREADADRIMERLIGWV